MSSYLNLLILAGIAPVILSFYPPLRIYQNIRALLASLFLILMIFGAWDVYATFRGHWYFNPIGVLPYRIINLPLEEVLFFIVIPFCCIFTWEVIRYLGNKVK